MSHRFGCAVLADRTRSAHCCRIRDGRGCHTVAWAARWPLSWQNRSWRRQAPPATPRACSQQEISRSSGPHGAGGSPNRIWCRFSRRGHAVTRSIRPHPVTIMRRQKKKLHQNQHLGEPARLHRAAQSGFSAAVTNQLISRWRAAATLELGAGE